MLDYIYEITAWRNGSEHQYIETPYRIKALTIAEYMTKNNPEIDSIDICKVQVGTGYMQSKRTFTLINGVWETAYQYIGEDEGR